MLAGRLADFLAASLPQSESAIAQSAAFLRSIAEALSRGAAAAQGATAPLDRLSAKLNLSQLERNLIVLAGLPEEHEGLAATLRALNPRGEPRPSAGLAAQFLAGDISQRPGFRATLESGPLTRCGVIRLTGDVPFFERSLGLTEGFWPALHGLPFWPEHLERIEGPFPVVGLEEWLDTSAARRGARAIASSEPCLILVSADSEEAAFQRALALVTAAGREAVGFRLKKAPDPDVRCQIQALALARDAVPVLRLPSPDEMAPPEAPNFDAFPDAVVFACRTGAALIRSTRPLTGLLVEPIPIPARRRMWSHFMPELGDDAARLASRYFVEPATAAEVAKDVRCVERLEGRACCAHDVAECLRSRASITLAGGVRLIRPRAAWRDLVLSRDREQQLQDAVARLDHQGTVLDDWGFLKGRTGARGVRMLFAGPPGTGKTLAAEVMANALEVDLLVVDISRVVSKWIGETEKNLASVFDAAERAQSVLFFDEADALFGRRTEVSDAHDRYANLETAYLLSRLERFEGLAIMATNLRQNIDPAFLRRLEFVVNFDEPDREARHQIWRRHIPGDDVLDSEVNLYELAALYPVVGGLIRNSAVAAAFLAAADGGRIMRGHLVRAVRREYEKAGKAFPGVPAGMARN
jgi:hypothetical protein